MFHHIPQVWELKLRTYYHLMREEKEPLWEDPSLARGGVWRIKCPKRETVSNHSNDPNKNFSFKVSTKSRYSVTAIVLLNYLPKEHSLLNTQHAYRYRAIWNISRYFSSHSLIVTVEFMGLLFDILYKIITPGSIQLDT